MEINSNNRLETGDIIAIEGEKPDAAYMVMKGKIRVYSNSFSATVGAGTLLFADDYVSGAYSFCAQAAEPSVVYAFASESGTLLEDFINSHKDYNGAAVYNQVKIVNELEHQFGRMSELGHRLFEFLRENYAEYINEARQTGCKSERIPEISSMKSCDEITLPDEIDLESCHEYARIPYEALKNFYAISPLLTIKLLREMYVATEMLSGACNEMGEYIEELFYLMYGNLDDSLFRNFLILDVDSKKNGLPSEKAAVLAEKCAVFGNEIISFYNEYTGHELITSSDAEMLEVIKEKAASGIDIRTNRKTKGQAPVDVTAEITALKGSFEQIIKFAKYSKEAGDEFRELLDQYIQLPDRESTDDRLRMLRKGLGEHFYALYAQAFGASVGTKKKLPKAVELFLDYGYLSENLLEKEQLEQLLQIVPITFNSPCNVYTIRKWLTAICRGEREPSRNDLGQDYAEVLRDLKKQGRISEEKEKELLNSAAMKLDFEIKNVFSKVNRIVNGQLTAFVPILHSEQLIGDVCKAYNSAKQINETVLELTKLDYSIFYRESLYVNQEAGIEREIIQKEVFPDIILCPTVGTNAVMWQEITGKRRDSKGRFMLPIITYTSVSDMLIKAFGEFRWALCKTVQGANWNNIQYQSLTAEYSDYIQFFKKNKELSDEKREKLKLQIQRGRNSLSRIFSMDYEMWMKAESGGSVRLNRVAREILATYCTFCTPVRKNLVKQPLYEEAFARSSRERSKKIHELEIRFKSLEKNGTEIPEELKLTMKFYREM